MARDSVDDDEALARVLQEEYEREYRQSIAASQNKRSTSSRRESGFVDEPDAVYASQRETEFRYSESNYPSERNGSALVSSTAHRSQRSSSRNLSSVPRGIIVEASKEPTAEHKRSSSLNNLDSQSQRRSQQAEAARAGTSVRRGRASATQNRSSSRPRTRTPVVVPEYINNSESNIEVYEEDQFPSIEEADDNYARHLQSRRNRDVSGALSPVNLYSSGAPMRNRTNSEFSDRTPVAALSDEELARRIEQELRDEEYAQRLSRTEMDLVSQQRAREVAAVSRQRRPCTVGKVCSYLIPITLILGAAAALTYYFTGNGKLPDFIPDPEAFREEDPFTQQDPSQANKWKIDGMNGLNMVILNALDSKWHQNFYTAVSEWDAGNPDALTLQTEVRTPDTACEAVTGRIKVCNGNYGETNWRGINKVLLDPVYIYASSARMNEYYFQDSSYEQMQYTMCHEIGHGFGLPHTDENFYNKDQGNCMDYTNNPKANMQPSTVNFDFLEQLYGTVDQQAASQVQVSNGGNRRSAVAANEDVPLPQWIRSAMQSIDIQIDSGNFMPTEMQGWRMLHKSTYGEAHEIDIGGGFKVQVHLLLA